jgi:putative membrane protein
MNMNTKSMRSVELGKPRLAKHTFNSASGTLAITLGLGLWVCCASAATAASAADQEFIQAAAQGGMTEVKLGELAGQKGQGAEVKEFGQMMVKDHSAINADLKAVAAKEGVTLPDTLNAKHQGMVDKLAALSGPEFDDAYVSAMIKAHKKDANAFKAEAAATQDPDIKSFLDKSIPVVEAHLQHVTAMKK